jgi:hypothetical protein
MSPGGSEDASDEVNGMAGELAMLNHSPALETVLLDWLYFSILTNIC